MRKLLYLTAILIQFGLSAKAQVPDVIRSPVTPSTGISRNNRAQSDANLYVPYSLRIPRASAFTLNGAKDSIGYVMFNTTSNRFGVYRGSGVWDTYLIAADIAGKANIANTLSGYGITDAFTETQSDARYQAALGFTPENVANKSTTTTLGTSNTLYPTQNAAKTYIDNSIVTTIYTVATIADMQSYAGNLTTVQVGDAKRGGTFVLTTLSDGEFANTGTKIAATAKGIQYVWARQYSGPVNVQWFNAKGDNSSDDTAPIQTAITAFPNVYIPQGTYIVNSTITIPATHNVFGDGNTTIIKGTGTTGSKIFQLGANVGALNYYIGLKDLKISPITSGLIGVYLFECANASVENVQVSSSVNNNTTGFVIDGYNNSAFFNVFKNCYALHVHIGFNILSTGTNVATQQTLIDCNVIGDVAGGDPTSIGYYFSTASSGINTNVTGGNLENCGTGIKGIQMVAVSFTATRFEGNTTDVNLDAISERNSFIACTNINVVSMFGQNGYGANNFFNCTGGYAEINNIEAETKLLSPRAGNKTPLRIQSNPSQSVPVSIWQSSSGVSKMEVGASFDLWNATTLGIGGSTSLATAFSTGKVKIYDDSGTGKALAFSNYNASGKYWYLGADASNLVSFKNNSGNGFTISDAGVLDNNNIISATAFKLNGAVNTGLRQSIFLNGDNTNTGSLYLQPGPVSAAYGGAIELFGNSHSSYPGSIIASTSNNASNFFGVALNNSTAPAFKIFGDGSFRQPLTGLLKGNGSSSNVTAAVAETDYMSPSGTASAYLAINGSNANATINIGSQPLTTTGNITGAFFTGSRFTFSTPNSTNYIITTGDNTSTGSIAIQPGGGSASYGAGVIFNANASASKPGSTTFFTSSLAGAKWYWNTSGLGGGSDIASLDRLGNFILSGNLTAVLPAYTSGTYLNTIYNTTNAKFETKLLSLTSDVTGILPIANGGTGSATQNFVDLTTAQASIGGAKTFTGQVNFSSGGSPYFNNGIAIRGGTGLSFWNVGNIYNGTLQTIVSANRAWVIKDSNGTFAFTSDLPLSGRYTTTASAQTTFTVTIGVTQPGTTYNVQVTPTSLIGATGYYVTNQTTTTFDVVYTTALTGTESFAWTVLQ